MTRDQCSEVGKEGLVAADMETRVLRVSCWVIVPSKSKIQWIGGLGNMVYDLVRARGKRDLEEWGIGLGKSCIRVGGFDTM